jgi:hypothetical protein
MQSLASILSTKENQLPLILLDSDKSGLDMRIKLLSDLYKGSDDRVLHVQEFNGMAQAEIEDLFPLALLEFGINKLFRSVDDEAFEDVYDSKLPIINQIQQFATKHRVALLGGWKVELAKQTKARLLQRGRRDLTDEVISAWTSLFQKFQ